MNVVTGTALNTLTSASGRVFAAWLPKATVSALIAKELLTPNLPPEVQTASAVETVLETARQTGVAAVAAPVFNAQGDITLSLLAIGVKEMIDLSLTGSVVTALKRSAHQLSMRLGYAVCADKP